MDLKYRKKQKTGRMKNIIFLSRYIQNYRWTMGLYIVVGTLYRALPVFTSFLLSYMVGAVLNEGCLLNYHLYFTGLLILIVLRSIGRYADTMISHDIAYRILALLRTKLYDRIEEISPAFFKNKRSGDILSVVMEDVNILEWFYAHTFGILFISLIITTGALLFLSVLHPVLMLSMFFWIVILILIHKRMEERAEKEGCRVRSSLGALSAELADTIHGIKDITAMNWGETYKKKLEKTRNIYELRRRTDNARKGMETALSRMVMSLASVSVLLISILLVKKGVLSSGWYLVIVSLSMAVMVPVSELLSVTGQLGIISAAAGRVVEILETVPLVQDTGKVELSSDTAPEIEFRDVSFTYPGEETPALNHLSFRIRAGEKVAIAGESGSGKTTIINLLQRFYEYDSGEIFIGGKSIREYSLASLRGMVSIVPQEIYLFNTSLRENIRIGREDAAPEEILEAAEEAGAEGFIRRLPKGFETIAGERGVRLSGGQKQRIAIARAFLKNGKILILDEASSNLDSNHETYLNQTLEKSQGKYTTIVIAHRIATLQSAERIIFIHNGRAEDTGSFSELEKKCSLFREVMSVGTIGEEV